jgi:hypothetical protein
MTAEDYIRMVRRSTTFPVRYSFLRRTATARVPLPELLAIVFKYKDNCRD